MMKSQIIKIGCVLGVLGATSGFKAEATSFVEDDIREACYVVVRGDAKPEHKKPPSDLKEAKKKEKKTSYALSGAIRGDPVALYDLAIEYLYNLKEQSREKNTKKAFQYMKLAADQRDQLALYDIAKMYLYGRGTEKDISKAFFYLNQAVEEDHPDAQPFLDDLLKAVLL